MEAVYMDSKNELKKQVTDLIRQYGMSSVMLRNAVSRSLKLNITDMECLSLLAIKGASTPKELANYTGMTSGAATAMLDRLEKNALITREPNTLDRRGVLIKPNRDSMKKIGYLLTGARTAQADIISSYSAKELEIISEFMERISKSNIEQVEAIVKNN